ncbi:MAG TPA: sigma-54-dependent Fis family transcriptional regulator [Deltaproteobacteria bacterium]|nr:sigma-54-dependent Fis family transcriptional regulator [Deltaproteobacteria bacterium]
MIDEKFKVLIVDDDSTLRELLSETIHGMGYMVDTAENGEDALNKLKREKYDLVVSDLKMPGMDGLKLLDHIKSLDSNILVIIITAYATLESAVKAIEKGAYDYIAKPFRLDEFVVVVRNACEKLRLLRQRDSLLEELRGAYAELERLRKDAG